MPAKPGGKDGEKITAVDVIFGFLLIAGGVAGMFFSCWGAKKKYGDAP